MANSQRFYCNWKTLERQSKELCELTEALQYRGSFRVGTDSFVYRGAGSFVSIRNEEACVTIYEGRLIGLEMNSYGEVLEFLNVNNFVESFIETLRKRDLKWF